MRVILKEDVEHLGNKNAVVQVKPGYARNYLLPRGLAITVNPANIKANEKLVERIREREAQALQDAQDLAAKLRSSKIEVKAKSSLTGKIFGTVTPLQICKVFEGMGYNISSRQVTSESKISQLGKHSINIKLHEEVEVDMEVQVVAE